MDFSIDSTAFGSIWMSNNAVIIASGGGITGDGEEKTMRGDGERRQNCTCCVDDEAHSQLDLQSPKHKSHDLIFICYYLLLIAFIICKRTTFFNDMFILPTKLILHEIPFLGFIIYKMYF